MVYASTRRIDALPGASRDRDDQQPPTGAPSGRLLDALLELHREREPDAVLDRALAFLAEEYGRAVVCCYLADEPGGEIQLAMLEDTENEVTSRSWPGSAPPPPITLSHATLRRVPSIPRPNAPVKVAEGVPRLVESLWTSPTAAAFQAIVAPSYTVAASVAVQDGGLGVLLIFVTGEGAADAVEACTAHAAVALGRILERETAPEPNDDFTRALIEQVAARELRHAADLHRPLSMVVLELAEERPPPERLVAYAAHLSEGIRQTDLTGYVDHRRLAVILPNTPESGALHTLRRLHRDLGGDASVRLGSATYPEEGNTWEELLRAALARLHSPDPAAARALWPGAGVGGAAARPALPIAPPHSPPPARPPGAAGGRPRPPEPDRAPPPDHGAKATLAWRAAAGMIGPEPPEAANEPPPPPLPPSAVRATLAWRAASAHGDDAEQHAAAGLDEASSADDGAMESAETAGRSDASIPSEQTAPPGRTGTPAGAQNARPAARAGTDASASSTGRLGMPRFRPIAPAPAARPAGDRADAPVEPTAPRRRSRPIQEENVEEVAPPPMPPEAASAAPAASPPADESTPANRDEETFDIAPEDDAGAEPGDAQDDGEEAEAPEYWEVPDVVPAAHARWDRATHEDDASAPVRGRWPAEPDADDVDDEHEGRGASAAAAPTLIGVAVCVSPLGEEEIPAWQLFLERLPSAITVAPDKYDGYTARYDVSADSFARLLAQLKQLGTKISAVVNPTFSGEIYVTLRSDTNAKPSRLQMQGGRRTQ